MPPVLSVWGHLGLLCPSFCRQHLSTDLVGRRETALAPPSTGGIGLDPQSHKPIRRPFPASTVPGFLWRSSRIIGMRSWTKHSWPRRPATRLYRRAATTSERILFSLGNHTRPAEPKLSRSQIAGAKHRNSKGFSRMVHILSMILGFGVSRARNCPRPTPLLSKRLSRSKLESAAIFGLTNGPQAEPIGKW